MSAGPKSDGERPPWYDIEVSITNGAASKKTSSITVGVVLERIGSDCWQIPVERIRDEYSKALDKAFKEGAPDPLRKAKDAVAVLKKNLPGVCWSGTFLERANAKLEAHSGLICIDLDNLGEKIEPIRQQLRNDPHVQAFFTSPTGTGLKVLFRINPDGNTHLHSFLAAKRCFRETYGVTIDEACKDVSRLCFVSYDPVVFIREEDSVPLEPLPPKSEKWDEAAAPVDVFQDIGPKDVILPYSGLITLTESAARLFGILGASESFYLSSGLIGCIETDKRGVKFFYPLSDQEFRSAPENDANFWAYRSDKKGGKPRLKPKALCSLDQARALMCARGRKTLPNISAIHNCPIVVELPDGRVETLGQGYHTHAGGRLITRGELPVVPSLKEAVDIILDMVREVSWLTPADQSRWVCIFLEPAFKSLCDWAFPTPIFVMEADASQSGKGFLLNLVNVTYNETPSFVTKRRGGVGGFDESLSAALLKAKPIILIDNFRGVLDSQLLEASMTCMIGSTIGARVPYKPEAGVNPHNYIFLITSNGLVVTEDLANRFCICRILHQGERAFARYPEGSILEHVRANQPKYLGAAHRIVREWCERGKQFSREDCRGVGAFRDWWQRSDWILRNLFGLPPPLDGHGMAQKRTANPTLGWLRVLYIKLEADNQTEVRGLSCTELFEFCELNDIEIPCGSHASDASKDKSGQVQRIGRLLAPLFTGGNDVYVGEGFSILRIEEPYYNEAARQEQTIKRYLFFKGPDRPASPPPPHP